MQWVVHRAKYRFETISVVLDFADDFVGGEVITGTPMISIVLDAGVDPTPSEILYQGITTTSTTVEQRFRLGVDGVIYIITYTVQTDAGNTYEKEFYLAILPQDGSAVPQFAFIYENSTLYPYELSDDLQCAITMDSGRLFQGLYAYAEGINPSLNLVGGTLIAAGITYNIPHEDIMCAITLDGGVLTYINNVTYAYNEDIQCNIAIIGATLIGTGITYNIPHEDITCSITLTSGTLA